MINDISQFLPSVKSLEDQFDDLWPICRSITGNGVRETINLLGKYIELDIHEIKTGTKVFDWEIPKEWNIRDAFIITPDGSKICDFKKNNLHVLNYSLPINKVIDLEELKNHLYSLPELPDAIPYVTSYYKERWGFCITEEQKNLLKPGKYEVYIDSTLESGSLTFGERVLKSTTGTDEEFLISTYICHPSMANNELSGPIVASRIFEALSKIENRNLNYRFVFIPETIGSIAFLSLRGAELKEKCVGGLVVTCCGDHRSWNYKRSRIGNTLIDKVVQNILEYSGLDNVNIHDFFPTGSDERQYCSPGFNLPIGSLTRSMYGTYKEYHTSLDDKSFIDFESINKTLEIYLKSLISFDYSRERFSRVDPFCEPQLGKRGLYSDIGALKNAPHFQHLLLYLLNFSDGHHSLVDIANKAKVSVFDMIELNQKLIENKLLKRA